MTSGKINPLPISAYTYSSCLGRGRAANWQAIVEARSGLRPCAFNGIDDLPTWVGQMDDLDQPLPDTLAAFDCRNNRLAFAAIIQDDFLDQARAQVAARGAHRVGVYMGTSTSGILHTETAYLETAQKETTQQETTEPETAAEFAALPDWYDYPSTHNVASLASFVQTLIGSSGPCVAISTACSSSAKVFASAARALRAGLIDAAIVGGVDTLCATTLYGFSALQLVSQNPCRPFDNERSGISIGEAAGFALLTRDAPATHFLLGVGESSDAYHMSSPHPEGEGAYAAMKQALAQARLTPIDIDYINLHGTGTQANDRAEARAVTRAFGDLTPASSTKGWTGHTLGAAGIIEIAIGMQAIEHQFVPANLNLAAPEPEMSLALIDHGRATKVQRILSNSFGFGGSNCSVIVGQPLAELAHA